MVKYRWSVFWADLNPVLGSEQAGLRPVLIISAEEANRVLPVIAVLPLTSYREGRKVYPTEVLLDKDETGLDRDSLVLAHQIRTIAKDRLQEKCGEIRDQALQAKIKRAVELFLGWF